MSDVKTKLPRKFLGSVPRPHALERELARAESHLHQVRALLRISQQLEAAEQAGEDAARKFALKDFTS